MRGECEFMDGFCEIELSRKISKKVILEILRIVVFGKLLYDSSLSVQWHLRKPFYK